MDEEECLLLCYVLLKSNEKQQRNRSTQVHPLNQSRLENGEYYRLIKELKLYESQFFDYFRMTKGTFQFILEGLKTYIGEPVNLFRHDTIGLEQRLAITLR